MSTGVMYGVAGAGVSVHAPQRRPAVLGQPGWREWLAGSLSLLGGAWLALQGLPALAGVPLLLVGLHFFCRRDDVAIDARSGRYRRRQGYIWRCREWQGPIGDLTLALRTELDEVRCLSCRLDLTLGAHPQAVLCLGVYPEQPAALADAHRLAARLGLIFDDEFPREYLP